MTASESAKRRSAMRLTRSVIPTLTHMRCNEPQPKKLNKYAPFYGPDVTMHMADSEGGKHRSEIRRA